MGDPSNSYVYTQSANPWQESLRRLSKNKVAVMGALVFVAICLVCIFAPFFTRWDYFSIDAGKSLRSPSVDHFFGTDRFGRDLFARILYGGRVTLRIAFVSTVLAAVSGSAIGISAGYFSGRADFIISHVLDVLASIPIFLLIIATEAALGWGKGYFMYAMAIAAMPQFARLVRASVMSIMGCEYIEAARALGVSNLQIVVRHVIHNIVSPLIVRFTSGIAEALILCTIMGYLGIGINPPNPEWGSLIYSSKSFIRTAPQLMVIPCVFIILTVVSISVFGDGLRDAIDPRDTVN